MNEQDYKPDVLDIIIERKGTFLFSFFVVFLVTYAFLAWVDFLPEPVSSDPSLLYSKEESEEVKKEENENKEEFNLENEKKLEEAKSEQVNKAMESKVGVSEEGFIDLPEKIIFDSLGKELKISNPTSREVTVLDEALLSGVVRHPDSATLNQNGAVFILGHSSYLPMVINKNFQAFNGIQNLNWGDTIKLVAGERIYVYSVDKVYRATATDSTVPIAGDRQRLILATCNSFGSIDDRYVVEADLLEIVPLKVEVNEA